jgi:hypothetical protein
MDRNREIDRLEIAMFCVVAVGVCGLVLALPNLVRYATVIGLGAFLVANAFLAVRQKRYAATVAFSAAAVFAFAFHGSLGLALAYVVVVSIILSRSIRADAADTAPAYILFGHEESRYKRSGFRSRM